MPRPRAVGVVVHDKQLLVMYRERDGERFYVFPGGGIDAGETIEQAVVRELDEETSIAVTIDKLLFELHHHNGDIHYYYLCTYISGTPRLRENTNEHADNLLGEQLYDPQWLPLADIGSVTLYPHEATQEFLRGLAIGFDGPSKTIEVTSY